MRIVKEINKGRMKISVFKYYDQYSIKCEQDQVDFIFKFNDGAITEEEIDKYYLNDEKIAEYYTQLISISKIKSDTLLDIQKSKGFEFPEII
jgi:hypothetical protein